MVVVIFYITICTIYMYDLSHLFTKSKLKLLRLLKKEEGLYIREIAERLAISPFSVHNSIKLFKKLGFVEVKKVKNRKTIYLVRDNPILKNIFSLINISDLSGNKNFKRLMKSGKVGVYGSLHQERILQRTTLICGAISRKKFQILN